MSHTFPMSSRYKLLRLFLGLLLIFIIGTPLLVLLLTLQGSAALGENPALEVAEIGQIEQLLIDSAPQAPASEGLHRVSLDEAQFNLLLRYGIEVTNQTSRWAATVALADDGLSAHLSVLTSDWLLPLYLNVRGEFDASAGQLRLRELQVGRLRVPQRFLPYAMARLVRQLAHDSVSYPDINELISEVREVHINAPRMEVTLHWDPVLINRLIDATRRLFLSPEDRARVVAYYKRIDELMTGIPVEEMRAISLNVLLEDLFSYAGERSATGANPVDENRALFQALTLYVNDIDIARLVGPELAADVSRPRYIEVRLLRRHDLARHLVDAAAITSSAGADIAELLSTTKEAYDARYRSGFSFSDLTAGNVGTTLAMLATRDWPTALEIQRRLAQMRNEEDYMPDVGNNRDGLSESDFNARYQDRNSEQYQQRLREIEELISTRSVFQGLI